MSRHEDLPTSLSQPSFVIFGGAGDLTWRKLVPALFTSLGRAGCRSIRDHRRRPQAR